MTQTKEKMTKAYRVAHEMLKDRLKDADQSMAEEFDELNESDILIVRGTYDFIEQVFNGIGLKYKIVSVEALDTMQLDPEQIVFINCPGNVSDKALRNLVSFVEKGGFLFTTDWALKHVVEKGFPGYIRYNGRSTGDEVVRVEILTSDDPFLKSLIGENDDPQWWLEGSSYPITVLDKDKVEVMVHSKEIKERHGEPAVFVSFDHGEGKIYHMISHFYLQRAETRTERHKSEGSNYLSEKLAMDNQRWNKYKKMGVDDANLAEVEAAYSSSTVMNKILWDKKKKSAEKSKTYDEEKR